MFLQIDARNGLAVYDQIVRQVKFAVADGAIAAGELVPSVRELARELAINPNTVARAYRQLQDDGVLESVRGTGLAVAAAARRRCQVERTKLDPCAAAAGAGRGRAERTRPAGDPTTGPRRIGRRPPQANRQP